MSRGRSLLELFGITKPPPPGAPLRAYQLPAIAPPQGRSLPFGPLTTTEEYGPDFELWQGNKLSVVIDTNPVTVQLSRTQPPNPPEWDAPFTIPLGPYSHVGAFGYFRFKDAVAGAHGGVQGAAFSE